ncbi:MAG: ParM/StbA family protein [Caldilineaceae bacterium]
MSSKPIDRLLSIDLGRTATKACTSLDPEAVVVIPANVKRLFVEEIRRGVNEADEGDPLLDIWLEYKGGGYAIGQLAADFGANLGLGKRKTEDALLKVFACLGYFGLWGQSVGLVLGLPFMSQQQFDEEKSTLLRLLEGSHTINYRGETVSVTIPQIWVMPEGYGSLILCEAQNQEQPGTRSFTKTSVAVMDIGYQTTDFLIFDRFRFARGASNSEEFAMAQFYERLAGQIPGADSQSLALIEAVNQSEGRRFYRPRGSSVAADLDTILPDIKANFARDLYNSLIRWLPERTNDIIITGGGGGFFWDNLRTLIKTSNLTPYLAQPPRQANALGQYIFGEIRLQEAQSALAEAR